MYVPMTRVAERRKPQEPSAIELCKRLKGITRLPSAREQAHMTDRTVFLRTLILRQEEIGLSSNVTSRLAVMGRSVVSFRRWNLLKS